MKINFDDADLKPLVELVVAKAIEQLSQEQQQLAGKLAFTEPEAAALLSIRPHVLRDARLRGEIGASRIGKRVLYERTELLQFLRRRKGV